MAANPCAAGQAEEIFSIVQERQVMDGPQVDVIEWSRWLFSFQGFLFVVSLIVILVIGTVLFRDWRRNRTDSSGSVVPDRE